MTHIVIWPNPNRVKKTKKLQANIHTSIAFIYDTLGNEWLTALDNDEL